jgi:hypothetical protein
LARCDVLERNAGKERDSFLFFPVGVERHFVRPQRIEANACVEEHLHGLGLLIDRDIKEIDADPRVQTVLPDLSVDAAQLVMGHVMADEEHPVGAVVFCDADIYHGVACAALGYSYAMYDRVEFLVVHVLSPKVKGRIMAY